jgi:hypothetical protein
MTAEERAEWAARLYLPSDRRQRLFPCALGRWVIHLTTDERCVAAVEVAEKMADGSATGAKSVRLSPGSGRQRSMP